MMLWREMIETDAHSEAVAIPVLQLHQSAFDTWAHHGLHGIGQHQNRMTARQHHLQNREHFWRHKRFAAREADFNISLASRV